MCRSGYEVLEGAKKPWSTEPSGRVRWRYLNLARLKAEIKHHQGPHCAGLIFSVIMDPLCQSEHRSSLRLWAFSPSCRIPVPSGYWLHQNSRKRGCVSCSSGRKNNNGFVGKESEFSKDLAWPFLIIWKITWIVINWYFATLKKKAFQKSKPTIFWRIILTTPCLTSLLQKTIIALWGYLCLRNAWFVSVTKF